MAGFLEFLANGNGQKHGKRRQVGGEIEIRWVSVLTAQHASSPQMVR